MAIEPENLLAHADFVRILARRLILDANQADDVAQNTFLAALEKPPGAAEALTSWLETVTRNFAFSLKRESKRREEREQVAALKEGTKGYVPSPADVLEREASRRRVVDAVLDLGEPYRDAVLLRYYENLPPREIARRLDLPVETVRTRLKRGLSQLRGRLDDHYGGDRKAWCLALAPIAGLKLAGPAAHASASSAAVPAAASTTVLTVLTGFFLLNSKVKLGIAAAVLFGAAALLWQVSSTGGSAEEGGGDTLASGETLGLFPPKNSGGTASGQAGSAGEKGFKSLNVQGQEAIESQGSVLAGRVIDMLTKEPVKRFDFQMAPLDLEDRSRNYLINDLVVNESIVNDSGLFSFPVSRGGDYQIWIYSSAHQMFETFCVPVGHGSRSTDLLFELDPGYSISGRVVEHETGKPVPGVLIGPRPDKPNGKLFTKRALFGRSIKGIHAWTAADGRFVLKGLNLKGPNLGREKIFARHPDFVEEVIETEPGERELLFQLKGGYRVTGRAYPDMTALTIWLNERPVLTDGNDFYKSNPLAPGKVRVVLESNTGPENCFGVYNPDDDYFQEVRMVNVVDRDVEVNFLRSPNFVTWRGTLYCSGVPAAGGRITVKNRTRPPTEPQKQCSVLCDESGRFELKPLVVGEFGVSIKLPDPYRCVGGDRITFNTPGIVNKDFHIAGGCVSGLVLDHSTGDPLTWGRLDLNIRTADGQPDSGPWSRVDGDGRFYLEGLAEGNYVLRSVGFNILGVENLGSGTLKDGKYRFHIEDKRIVQNVRILASSSWGHIHMTVEGFENTGVKEILPTFTMKGGAPFNQRQRPWELMSNGTVEKFFMTPPVPGKIGECTLNVTAGDYIAERAFTVTPGAVTELTLSRKQFEYKGQRVHVTGKLERADGSRMAGVKLQFSQEDFNWTDKPGYICHTDLEGWFSPEGLLKPGDVYVRATLDGCWLNLTGHIPEQSEDPFPLHFIIPTSGKLTGTLLDGKTGLPFNYKSHDTFGVLIELLGSSEIQWTTGLMQVDDGRFAVEGIPEGTYRLKISVLEYLDYTDESITITGGRKSPLGDIVLNPDITPIKPRDAGF